MSYGLYIHLPFCRSRCPYCAFYSTTTAAKSPAVIESYIDACSREMTIRKETPFNGSPETIYIGGGTPSLIEPWLLQRLIDVFPEFTPGEFSIEANPDSITDEWLYGIRSIGADRISIGIQALDDRLLKLLGRIHTTEQAKNAVRRARAVNFSSLSIDLMFGIPGQTVDIWKSTLEAAIALDPQHISAYSLGIEEDTEYYDLMSAGGLTIPDESETADMYFILWETLENNGYDRYELSNFARSGHECIHNKNYWNFTPYMGIGASAHSFDGETRSWNHSDIKKYIDCLRKKSVPLSGQEKLTEKDRITERLMLSLRTAEGFALPESPAMITEYFSNTVETLKNKDYLYTNTMNRLSLTSKGAILADEIISELATTLYHKPINNV